MLTLVLTYNQLTRLLTAASTARLWLLGRSVRDSDCAGSYDVGRVRDPGDRFSEMTEAADPHPPFPLCLPHPAVAYRSTDPTAPPISNTAGGSFISVIRSGGAQSLT